MWWRLALDAIIFKMSLNAVVLLNILLWCSMSLGGGKSTVFNNAVNAAVDSVSRNTVTIAHLYSQLTQVCPYYCINAGCDSCGGCW